MSPAAGSGEDPKRRFLRLAVQDNGDCLLWSGTRHRLTGYGMFKVGAKRSVLAHRWWYEQNKGPIPEGFDIDHLCRVRACVNPDHLEAVTRQENLLRGMSPVALNARRTHCAMGHVYDKRLPANDRRGGQRRCSKCRNAYNRAWRAAQKAPTS